MRRHLLTAFSKPVRCKRIVGELIEPLPCIPRTELCRLLVPAARLGRIGRDADRTKALEKHRIEGSTECKRGLCITAFGRATKRKARSDDIANDEKGTPASQQGRRLLVANPWRGRYRRSGLDRGRGG